VVDDSLDNSMIVNHISYIQTESKTGNNNEFNIKKEIEQGDTETNENEILDMLELKINDDVVSDIKKNRKKNRKNKNVFDINNSSENINIDLVNNSTNLMTSSSKLNKFIENLNKSPNYTSLFNKKAGSTLSNQN